MKTIMTLAAGGVLLASPAVAQMAEPEAGAPAATQSTMEAPAGSFTDEEIAMYAEAAVKISEMQSDATLDAAARQNGALAVLEESGLAPQRFNEISDATRTDPELAQRVQLAVANLRGGPGA